MEALQKDIARVVQENNRLHADCIAATEGLQSRERERYSEDRRKEAEVEEARFARDQAWKRAEALERDVAATRELVQARACSLSGRGGEGQPGLP